MRVVDWVRRWEIVVVNNTLHYNIKTHLVDEIENLILVKSRGEKKTYYLKKIRSFTIFRYMWLLGLHVSPLQATDQSAEIVTHVQECDGYHHLVQWP